MSYDSVRGARGQVKVTKPAHAKPAYAAPTTVSKIIVCATPPMVPTSAMIRGAAERFRHNNAIEDEEGFERWLAENNFSFAEFLELMKDQARVEWVQNLAQMEAEALVPDHLRLTGHYARLAKRARDKQRAGFP